MPWFRNSDETVTLASVKDLLQFAYEHGVTQLDIHPLKATLKPDTTSQEELTKVKQELEDVKQVVAKLAMKAGFNNFTKVA